MNAMIFYAIVQRPDCFETELAIRDDNDKFYRMTMGCDGQDSEARTEGMREALIRARQICETHSIDSVRISGCGGQ